MSVLDIAKQARDKGLKIMDAKAPLVLEVTRHDITNAKPKDPSCCAFACAVKRELGANAAYFFRTVAWIEYEDRIVRYQMPDSMQKEVVAFDRAKAMEPGVYQLSRPGPSRTTKGRSANRKRASRRKGSTGSGRSRASKRSPAKHKMTNIRTTIIPA